MKNFKIIIEYDGTDYFGWQRQKDSNRHPSIQGKIEEVLFKLFRKKIHVTGSGRTDTGVHAMGQAANFRVHTKIPLSNILRAINTYTPKDIVVKQIKEIPVSFNARYGAKRKWYRYTILNRKLNDVFKRNYVLHIPYKLDLNLMKKAAELFKGRHDFSHITEAEESNIRNIYDLTVSKKCPIIYIDIVSSGFLYKMVRRIAGILLDVGRGRIAVDDVGKLIAGKKRKLKALTVPARGLCLMEVKY